MPTTQSPLIVTIDTISLSFAGGPATQYPLLPEIKQYTGQRLFCQVTNTATGLTIGIGDKNPPDMLSPGGTATSAVVTVTYDKAPAAKTNPSPVTIDYKGNPLIFKMKIRSDLKTGILLVKEDMTGGPGGPTTKPVIGYVLVQDLTNPDDPKNDYTVHWIPLDDQLQDIIVEDPTKRATARILPPPPKNGGLGGPMGLTVP